MNHAAHEFVQGLNFWLNGWKHILTHRRLLLPAAIPFCISFIAAIMFLRLGWTYYPQLLAAITPSWLTELTGLWYALVYYPLATVIGLAVMLVVLYTVYVLHLLLAIPFYAWLAERTLKLKGSQVPRLTLGLWLRMIRVSVIKAILFLCLGLVLFVMSFVPVLNVVAVSCALLLLAFDCFDYGFEAKHFGLRQRVRYVLNHKGQWLGAAVALALTLLLPGLTFLVIPGAVVGAALMLKEAR